MYKGVDADYYGFRDDEDGILVEAEVKAEKKAREAAMLDWDLQQINKGREDDEEEYEPVPMRKRKLDDSMQVDTEHEKKDVEERLTKKYKIRHKSHVPLPSDEEIEKLLLERRKQELVSKYLN